MPKAFPEEFRRDVVAVACRREAPMSQVAKDFGIAESCLARWVKRLVGERLLLPVGRAAGGTQWREVVLVTGSATPGRRPHVGLPTRLVPKERV